MDTDVLIIGGGLSGLSLAKALQEDGRDYRLLEARARLGGRILSSAARDTRSPDDRYDLGPAWVWPHQPRVRRLIDEFDLRVFDQYASGRLVLQESDGSVRRDLEFSTMAGSQRLGGGFGRLTEKLAERLPSQQILTGHPVARIRRASTDGEPAVAVTGQAGETDFTITATTVVLALPPRVAAGTIDFGADFPAAALAAMAAVPTWMAGHAKVIAVYGQPFWRERGLSGDGISRHGPLVELHDATPLSGNQGAISGFVGVPVGSAARDRQRLIETSVAQLAMMYGADAAQPVEVMVLDWAREVQTATPADYTALADHPAYGVSSALANLWDGKLILASTEMAQVSGGYLEGALEAAAGARARLATARAERTTVR